jgi:hypothetical protein
MAGWHRPLRNPPPSQRVNQPCSHFERPCPLLLAPRSRLPAPARTTNRPSSRLLAPCSRRNIALHAPARASCWRLLAQCTLPARACPAGSGAISPRRSPEKFGFLSDQFDPREGVGRQPTLFHFRVHWGTIYASPATATISRLLAGPLTRRDWRCAKCSMSRDDDPFRRREQRGDARWVT